MKQIYLIPVLILFFCGILNAQNDTPKDSIPPDRQTDEVPLTFKAEKVGTFTLNVFISNDEVFIPVSELFKIVKVNVNLVKSNSFASGFFITEDNNYFIDASSLKAELKGIETQIGKQDFIINDSIKYF